MESVTLKLVEIAASDRANVLSSIDGFDEDWWRPDHFGDDDRLYSVVEGDRVVALVAVEQNATIAEHMNGPHAGKQAHYISFLEVNEGARRRGVGGLSVSLVADALGGIFCAAVAPEALGAREFWRSIGWVEYPNLRFGITESGSFVTPCAQM